MIPRLAARGKLVLGTALFAGLLVVVSNLAVDLLYTVFDPRVRQ